MRLRNIPGAEEIVSASPFVIHAPAQYRGRWGECFGNDHPLRIEVGMGKGRFLTELAAGNHGINYIGIERYTSVLLRAVEKANKLEEAGNGKEESGNFRFLCEDAARLEEIFAPGEVDRIYLNFSDPWPKERHAKRRLTSDRFLVVYRRILRPEGQVEFKTDNRELFLFSLESVEISGWNLVLSTADLHHSIYCADNVMTEYEERFSSQGNPIYKMVADRQPAASVNTGESVI